MIGMGAVITKTLKMESYSKYVGNPAKYLKSNK
jgi:acetyltransferase-like isoleucine patch superfamily enzyme